jgi:DNA-binding NtrC family response regulator
MALLLLLATQLLCESVMPRRLLLVESDPGVRGALGRLLTDEGYDVVLCSDVDSAAAGLGTEKPRAAILDLNVPMSAEAARYRMSVLRRAEVPVIVITALSGQVKAIIAAGAFMVMEKPLSLPLLLQTVERLVSTSQSEAEPGARINEDFRCEQ